MSLRLPCRGGPVVVDALPTEGTRVWQDRRVPHTCYNDARPHSRIDCANRRRVIRDLAIGCFEMDR